MCVLLSSNTLIDSEVSRQCTISHLKLDELFAGMPGDENENVALAPLAALAPMMMMVVKWLVFIIVSQYQ